MSEDKNDKNIEDEIEELLGKIDDFPFGMIGFGTNSSSGIEQMWRGKTVEFKQPPLMFRLWRKVRALFRR